MCGAHFDVGAAASGHEVRQVVVDLAIGNHDAALHFAFAQAREDDLLANLLAELGPGDAVLFQRRAEVLQRELVAFGDAAHGGVEVKIRYAQPGFLGVLELHAIGDHALEQLLFQDFARRQLHLLVAQLALHGSEAGAQLVGGDGFVVDHGDDAVDLQRLRAWRLGMGQRDGEAGEQAEQQNAKFHGVSKGDSEFCWLIRP